MNRKTDNTRGNISESGKETIDTKDEMKQGDGRENEDVTKIDSNMLNKDEEDNKGNSIDEEPKNLPDINTFEDLLQVVGTRGRWNLLLFLLCSYASFVSPMQTLSYQFLGATPDYWCRVDALREAGWTQEQIFSFAIPVDEKGKRETCRMYDHNYTLAVQLGYKEAVATLQDTPALVSCSARDFNRSQHQSTMTTQWDLVCERRALYSTTQAAAHIGKLSGALVLGYVIDLYGRRKVVLWCSVLSILSGFGSVLSPNVEMYIFFKIIIVSVLAGIYLGCFTLLLETSGNRERTRISTLFVVPWALGYMILPGVAYLVRPWTWLQAVLSLPTLVLPLYYWFLPESPRWLMLQGRHEEAIEVLTEAAKTNKKQLPPDKELLAIMQRLQNSVSGKQETSVTAEERTSESRCRRAAGFVAEVVKEYLAVVRVRDLRARALVVFFCWFAASLVYYGISLNATNISADPYLYIFLGGALEVPSYLILWPVIVFLGRVKALALLYLLCAIAILILALLIVFHPGAHIGILMLFSLSGKVAITMGFHLIWLFTLELFPTKYRSLATSQASVCARVGSVSSPYINDILGEVVSWAPSALFSIVSLLAAGLSLLLPETSGRSLPEGNTFEKHSNNRGKDNLAYSPEVDVENVSTTKRETNGSQFDKKGNVTTYV